MNSAKVSIIVPIYNVKNFLSKCVDSILCQTLEELEVILVDDGSTDGSGDICDWYKTLDRRVFVIHQQNGGLSNARNVGMDNSTAPYILFVDGDDYIHPEACERLYNCAKDFQCEIVAANDIVVAEGKELLDEQRKIEEGRIISGKDFLVESLMKGGMSMCAQFSLYQRKLLKENKLYFKEGILHEDEQWTPRVFLQADRVMCIDFAFYYHLVREGSITHSKNKEKNSKDLIRTCLELYDIYLDLDNVSRKYLNDYLCGIYLNAVYIGRDYRSDRFFPLKTAWSFRNRVKAVFYLCFPHFYILLNSKVKQLSRWNEVE